jgi:hypothetical protein
MDTIWIPVIKGAAVAIFIMAATDLKITDIKWWVAIISLNILTV